MRVVVVPQLLMLAVLFCVSLQYKYHLKYERAQVRHFSKRYYSEFFLDTKLVNRTFRTLKLGFNLIKPLDESTKLFIGAAKFVSNEYRQGAIQFTGTTKVFFKQKAVTDILNKYCKPDMFWPLKINVPYRCHSFMPTLAADFDAYFPTGRWLTNVTQFVGTEKVYELNVYASIEEVFS